MTTCISSAAGRYFFSGTHEWRIDRWVRPDGEIYWQLLRLDTGERWEYAKMVDCVKKMEGLDALP